MNDSDRLERFAELVVRVGANVQPGSGVLLGSDIAHLEIARAVVEHAYAAGASWVEVEWSDGPIRRSRLTHASIETLARSRPWAIERTKAWAAGRGVSIMLRATLTRICSTMSTRPRRLRFRWTRCGPTERRSSCSGCAGLWSRRRTRGWAQDVFGEPDVERLWDAVATAMRLDEADPVACWRERAAQLAARGRALDALELTEIRYRSADTDLTVGLVPDSR